MHRKHYYRKPTVSAMATGSQLQEANSANAQEAKANSAKYMGKPDQPLTPNLGPSLLNY